MTRQLAALRRMNELAQAGAQFIVATHSPMVMAYPDARILLIDGGELRETAYIQTEHFQVARRFLNDYRKALDDLLAD